MGKYPTSSKTSSLDPMKDGAVVTRGGLTLNETG
jgi:hypothetical protein